MSTTPKSRKVTTTASKALESPVTPVSNASDSDHLALESPPPVLRASLRSFAPGRQLSGRRVPMTSGDAPTPADLEAAAVMLSLHAAPSTSSPKADRPERRARGISATSGSPLPRTSKRARSSTPAARAAASQKRFSSGVPEGTSPRSDAALVKGWQGLAGIGDAGGTAALYQQQPLQPAQRGSFSNIEAQAMPGLSSQGLPGTFPHDGALPPQLASALLQMMQQPGGQQQLMRLLRASQSQLGQGADVETATGGEGVAPSGKRSSDAQGMEQPRRMSSGEVLPLHEPLISSLSGPTPRTPRASGGDAAVTGAPFQRSHVPGQSLGCEAVRHILATAAAKANEGGPLSARRVSAAVAISSQQQQQQQRRRWSEGTGLLTGLASGRISLDESKRAALVGLLRDLLAAKLGASQRSEASASVGDNRRSSSSGCAATGAGFSAVGLGGGHLGASAAGSQVPTQVAAQQFCDPCWKYGRARSAQFMLFLNTQPGQSHLRLCLACTSTYTNEAHMGMPLVGPEHWTPQRTEASIDRLWHLTRVPLPLPGPGQPMDLVEAQQRQQTRVLSNTSPTFVAIRCHVSSSLTALFAARDLKALVTPALVQLFICTRAIGAVVPGPLGPNGSPESFSAAIYHAAVPRPSRVLCVPASHTALADAERAAMMLAARAGPLLRAGAEGNPAVVL